MYEKIHYKLKKKKEYQRQKEKIVNYVQEKEHMPKMYKNHNDKIFDSNYI